MKNMDAYTSVSGKKQKIKFVNQFKTSQVEFDSKVH